VYSSCFVYRTLATELHRTLAGKRILTIFSTSKDEILFQFGELHEELQLTVNFAGGEMFFKLGNTITQRGKYAIQWFRRLENDVIHNIHTVPNDRGFVILTASGHQLYFKGFGKFGNIVFFAVEQPLPDSIFRNQLKRDLSLPQPILVKEESYVFKAELPNYLSGEQKQFLKEKGYHEASEEHKIQLWQQLIASCMEHRYFITNSTDPPQLLLTETDSSSHVQGIEGLTDYVQEYLHRFYFLERQKTQIQEIEAKLQHLKRLEQDYQTRLNSIANKRSYKELGDIVMAYAHSLKPGLTSALLQDFYTGLPLRVKLDPNLNSAENAEKYYRKAKNEHLEKSRILENLEHTATQIRNLEVKRQNVLAATDFRTLGKENKKPSSGQEQVAKPYKEMQFQGYEIWIGKNAKGNDEMLKLASRNDMWLHARGVTGSHVIVRFKTKTWPEEVLQYAAVLAAKNSKAQHQSIVPVIASERKYVSKGKKLAPGEVKVLKERVIDAFIDL
jgi:predicted ribosome quality control (RQC) complex YloA/Tae2 family protein